jgi:hypothetical protein
MREDLTDLRTRMDAGFAQVDRKFAEVDRGFAEMRGLLDASAAGQQQIVGLLNTLISQKDDQQP